MDHQLRTIDSQAEQINQVEILRRDRAKAQLVMDSQHEQLDHWVAKADGPPESSDQRREEDSERSEKACRSFAEKVLREIRRLPRNLGISSSPRAAPPTEKPPAVVSSKPIDWYAA